MRAGFELKAWHTYGFLGFCFFKNSDVLMFNRPVGVAQKPQRVAS